MSWLKPRPTIILALPHSLASPPARKANPGPICMCFWVILLEIFDKELSDSLEKLDARGRVANGMAPARKNQQVSGIIPMSDERVQHLRGIRKVNVVIPRAVNQHKFALQIADLVHRRGIFV